MVAGTPLDRAAARVLDSRASAVRAHLAQVLDGPGKDPEDVHQLRVATRRFTAALSIFRNSLQGRRRRELRGLARRLRQSAGDLRDLDVLESMLQDRLRTVAHRANPVHGDCARVLARRRQMARRQLVAVGKSVIGVFARSVADAQDRFPHGEPDDASGPLTLGGAGEKLLRKRLKDLRAAAHRDLDNLESLHTLRIAAKRLRYAMEIFASCYPAKFRQRLYARVERIQEDLGHVNDLRNLVRLVREVRRKLVAGGRGADSSRSDQLLKAVARSAKGEMKTCQRAFLIQWSDPEFAAFHREFKELLARRSGRPSRSYNSGTRMPSVHEEPDP